MFDLAKCGRYQELSEMLKADPRGLVEAIDADGHTLLHWAALADEHQFLKSLLAAADFLDARNKLDWVNKQSDKTRQTAAMWAVIQGNVKSLGLLKWAGASLTVVDSLKASLPILAIQHHRLEILVLLAKWGGLGDKDNNGCGLPHWAAYKGDVDSLRLLHLWVGQDMRGADCEGMTPLHRAASIGADAAVRFLVKNCYVDPAAVNHANETAADLSRRIGNFKVALFLDKFTDEKQGAGKFVEDGGRSEVQVKKIVEDKDSVESMFKWILPSIYVCVMALCLVVQLIELKSISVVFLVCVPISLSLFGYLVKGDSGRRDKRRVGQTAIEELQSQLDRIASGAATDFEEKNDINQICLTCMDWKGPRSKHCSTCDACVDNFDHHCVWLNNCVAKKNHRLFVLMLYATSIGQLAHFYLTYTSIEGDGWLYPVIGSFSTKPLLFICMCLHVCLTPFIGLLALFHTRVIALNMNTNESHNMHKYSHFWRKLEGVPNADPTAVEFVNPFDQGIVTNCYNFWTAREDNSGLSNSKVKYIELKPVGKCCDSHSHQH